jgi:hypothetical protein
MKASIRFLLFAASVVFFGQTAANKVLAADPLLGQWQNQVDKPSTLTITAIDNAAGMVRGMYQDGSTGVQGPVVGWVLDPSNGQAEGDNVTVLSFSARLQKIGSVTGWTGYLRNDPKTGTPTLYMQWNLSRNNSEFDWDHILANQDRFTHK